MTSTCTSAVTTKTWWTTTTHQIKLIRPQGTTRIRTAVEDASSPAGARLPTLLPILDAPEVRLKAELKRGPTVSPDTVDQHA
jgi:hypothetical protein